MVICYLNIIGVPAFPDKADSPLIVDPDAALPPAIALKGFETVARRGSEIIKVLCLMKVQELSPRNPFDRTKRRHVQVIEKCPGFCTSERPDHNS
jgi:hypothetical protein